MIPHTAVLLALSALVLGHGRVTQPPSRASAWRYDFPTPANYDDDGLNCGGFSTQWSGNGGKCGICGDAYNIPPPRPHELGGTYGLGIIVAKYLPGALIATTTHLTASHMGYWEFKLCPDPTDNSQACFDKHPLTLENGDTKFTPTRGSAIYNVNYRLPAGLICDHCVLQWRYVAGNNWGVCGNGTAGLGCGNQEEFRACSDIAIGMSKTLNDDSLADKIPSPLFFYLQNGFFELDQGYLLRKDPKRPTRPHRPSNLKPSHRQPKPSLHGQPTTANQQPKQPKPYNQQPNQAKPYNQQPNQAKPYNQQPNPSTGYTAPSNARPNPYNQQSYPNQQSTNFNQQHNPSNRQSTSSNQQAQPYNQQSHPSNGHQTSSNHQPNPYNQQPYPSNRQPTRSGQQPHPSNRQPTASNSNQQTNPYNRNPSTFNRESKPSNRPTHTSNPTKSSNLQLHPNLQSSPSNQQTKPSNQQRNPSNHQPKNSHRHPKSDRKAKPSNRQPKFQRYSTGAKRKTKQKGKSKKRKKTQHGKQKTHNQRYNYL